jgi:hypothetical protein
MIPGVGVGRNAGPAEGRVRKLWHKDQSLLFTRFRLAGDDEGGGFGGDGIVGASGYDFSDDSDFGLAEDVDYLGFFEARGVVLERQMVFGFIDAEAAEAVGIGKFTQAD